MHYLKACIRVKKFVDLTFIVANPQRQNGHRKPLNQHSDTLIGMEKNIFTNSLSRLNQVARPVRQPMVMVESKRPV
jgi:hypothetical protein